MRQIFIECGTALRSPFNTGIQRVVRSIVNELKAVGEYRDCKFTFIEFRGDRFLTMDQLDGWRVKNRHGAISKLLFIARQIDILLGRVIKREAYLFIRSRVLPIVKNIYYKYTSRSIERSVLAGADKVGVFNDMDAGQDILILLDSSWNNEMWSDVDKFRARGGVACAVLYDLIPFTHPETVEEQTRYLHTNWWRKAPNHLDRVICISKTVRDEFIRWQEQGVEGRKIKSDDVRYFYLGAELSRANDKGSLIDILTNKHPTFLVVGSIEPRKNHSIILDAFEILWKENRGINLVIVGGNGWKTESVLNRIEVHDQLNSKLFLLRHVSDYELTLLYTFATALIIASSAEGFGLPIVEASLRGTDVICSDIPVFKEVAGDNATYFRLNDSVDLAATIIKFNSKKSKSISITAATGRWNTWQESAFQLVDQALK
jgi:glycosyltransferase involved in cell wall biosynthesis